MIGNGINIILDWLFIIRFGMGTAGAALATSIGFLCATIYEFICIYRASKTSRIVSLSPAAMRTAKIPVVNIVKIGIPGALITILLSVSNIVLNNYIAIYGSNAVAAYGIAYKIEMFPIMLSVGFSQGVAPLVGYCYGARQNARMNKVMISAMIDNVLIGAVFTGVFLIFSRTLVSIFLHEHTLIDQSALFLRIMGLSAPMLGVINIVIAYYQALGKAFHSLLITLLRNIILFIPGVILLNSLAGLIGSISAQPVVETVLSVICAVMYLASRRTGTSDLFSIRSR